MIEIAMKSGDVAHYKPEEYTDYKYDGKCFIVIHENQWIGIYNMKCVEYITIEKGEFSGI
jgi:predicted DNA-binding protein (MmcQ/YjbR family)